MVRTELQSNRKLTSLSIYVINIEWYKWWLYIYIYIYIWKIIAWISVKSFINFILETFFAHMGQNFSHHRLFPIVCTFSFLFRGNLANTCELETKGLGEGGGRGKCIVSWLAWWSVNLLQSFVWVSCLQAQRECSRSIWLLKCIGHVVRRAIKLSKLMIAYRIYPCTHKVRPRKGCGDYISSHFSYQSQVYIESVASCRIIGVGSNSLHVQSKRFSDLFFPGR